jgi:phosphoribosyl 1,2-cyclic phosphodiesterase
MVLIVNGSSSSGNSYALVSSSDEILLIEAGVKMAEVKKSIDYKIGNVVGCIASHRHGDHSKYAVEYAKFGVKMYCNKDTADNKSFPYDTCKVIEDSKTYRIGKYSVAPFNVEHDVPCQGFLIKHPEMVIMLFATDTFKIPITITGINHFLIEANYEDSMLKENVKNGSISKAQSDRIMLSHMSLNYCIEYLRDCEADKSAKTITLCHLSERNSDPAIFRNTVAGAFGVPTFIAQKGLVVELNKDEI